MAKTEPRDPRTEAREADLARQEEVRKAVDAYNEQTRKDAAAALEKERAKE